MDSGRLARGLRGRLFRSRSRATADRDPPAPPPGWHTGPPDFIGIGVQRAGTTWWFRELRRHPKLKIAPGSRKELHYFDVFADRELTSVDIERYHRWFARPDGSITGEWTPLYIYEPWVLPLTVRAAPATAYLLLLRDPIERFGSGLEFALGRGMSYNDAVLDAFHRGLYAGQVARLFQHVPRDRVLVQLYEDLRSDPNAQRDLSARFLGLDPERFREPVEARPPTARGPGPRNARSPLMLELQARYCSDLTHLARLLPDLDFGRWQSLQH